MILTERDLHDDCRASPFLAFDTHLALVQADQFVNKGKSYCCAFMSATLLAADSMKSFEKLRQLRFGNSNACSPIELSVWHIHRKIGMSGGLFTDQLLRETRSKLIPNGSSGCGGVMPRPTSDTPSVSAGCLERASCSAGSPRAQCHGQSRPAAGWKPLRSILRRWMSIPSKSPSLPAIRWSTSRPVPRCRGAAGRPDERAIVVGDSIWDMLTVTRCRAIGVWLLSGGYGSDEMRQAGLFSSTRIRPIFWITSTR
jgi:hypothetical protein